MSKETELAILKAHNDTTTLSTWSIWISCNPFSYLLQDGFQKTRDWKQQQYRLISTTTKLQEQQKTQAHFI